MSIEKIIGAGLLAIGAFLAFGKKGLDNGDSNATIDSEPPTNGGNSIGGDYEQSGNSGNDSGGNGGGRAVGPDTATTEPPDNPAESAPE